MRVSKIQKPGVIIMMAGVLLLSTCTTPIDEPAPPAPAPTPAPVIEPPPSPEPPPVSPPADEPEPPPEEPVDEFAAWWEEFHQPFNLDSSAYPDFYRGAWGARLDELRNYLLNIGKLRDSGVDSIAVEAEIVLDSDTHEPKSIGKDIFIFYLQALKKAGFRILLIPNPMHPNLDQGLGYDWERTGDPDVFYNPSYEFIKKFDGEVLKWAAIAEEYGADAFLPILEPFKLAGDYEIASQWLQEILPRIREVYHGQVWATDIMYDIGKGLSTPCPYDYSGYDFLLSGPPAGRKNAAEWEDMITIFIEKGLEYSDNYSLNGFGLYEYGGYTGGVWYEDSQMEVFDQILSQEEAAYIAEALVRQAAGKLKASFPRISIGWTDFDTPSYEIITDWYRGMGENVSPVESTDWTYDKLIEIEQKLGGDDYQGIFQITETTGNHQS